MNDPHGNQPVRTSGRNLQSARAAVIMVHGRGASAEDILSLADEFDLPDFAYLAPQAAGHAWYPYSFLSPLAQNQPWLDSALAFLGRLVQQAVEGGMPREKVALVGFSQGACLSTEFLARSAARLGGLVAFTGGLIGPPGTAFKYPGDLAGTPCFLGSGDPDPHVPWERVQESAAVLSVLNANVTLRRYPGLPHTINQDELGHARQLLSRLAVEE